MRFIYKIIPAILALPVLMWSGCATSNPSVTRANGVDQNQSADERIESPQHGTGHQVLWYVPNRFFDLVDIFRLRVRVGPGLALNARVTDHADVFIGTYYTAFAGLPGPRLETHIRWPWGLEYEKGIKLMGVDATDDLPHEPGYAPTEFNAGLQLLLLGAELGFDPVELGDFFTGWLMIDLRGDDR